MQVIALHNKHYFQSLLQLMDANHTYMVIDSTGVLYHKDEINSILAEYNMREAL